MELKRFFIDKANFNNNQITLDGVEHNHLSNVLRLKKGEHIIVVMGDGFDYECEICDILKKETKLKVLNKTKNVYDPKINVTIYQAIIKGDNMPLVVQKLNELGVNTLCPIITKFTVALGGKNLVQKLTNTANQSVKQCKRSIPLKICEIKNIKDIVQEFKNYDLVLLPYEKENSNNIQSVINTHIDAKNIAVVVGSEGGFDVDEVEMLENYGAIKVTMGPRILRAETACIALSSVLMYAFGEWNKWKQFWWI